VQLLDSGSRQTDVRGQSLPPATRDHRLPVQPRYRIADAKMVLNSGYLTPLLDIRYPPLYARSAGLSDGAGQLVVPVTGGPRDCYHKLCAQPRATSNGCGTGPAVPCFGARAPSGLLLRQRPLYCPEPSVRVTRRLGDRDAKAGLRPSGVRLDAATSTCGEARPAELTHARARAGQRFHARCRPSISDVDVCPAGFAGVTSTRSRAELLVLDFPGCLQHRRGRRRAPTCGEKNNRGGCRFWVRATVFPADRHSAPRSPVDAAFFDRPVHPRLNDLVERPCCAVPP